MYVVFFGLDGGFACVVGYPGDCWCSIWSFYWGLYFYGPLSEPLIGTVLTRGVVDYNPCCFLGLVETTAPLTSQRHRMCAGTWCLFLGALG